jgi:hypothetical protein
MERSRFRVACNLKRPQTGAGRRLTNGRLAQTVALCGLLAAACSGAACSGAAVRSAGSTRPGLDIVVLLDNSADAASASMPGADGRTKRLEALQVIENRLAPGDRLAVVAFDAAVHTPSSRLQELSEPARETLDASVRSIAAAPRDTTNMTAGLRAASRILSGRRRGSEAGTGARRQILLLLAGHRPNPPAGDNSPEELLRYAVRLGRHAIAIWVVGLGDLSSNPGEQAETERLLSRMALATGGAAHFDRRAGEPLALLGRLFSQLAGHDVSISRPQGRQSALPLPGGVRELTVSALDAGGKPGFSLTSPHGRAAPVTVRETLAGGVHANRIVVARVADPDAGVWKIGAPSGQAEVSYQPGLEVEILSPPAGARIPAGAPVPIRAALRSSIDGAPIPPAGIRVEADYDPGQPGSAPIPLTVDRARGQFIGALPSSGVPGSHTLRLRCFRKTRAGTEEGGPAYATLLAASVPALQLLSPQPGQLFAASDSIEVDARLQLDGRPHASGARGLYAAARLMSAGPDRAESLPNRDGRIGGVLKLHPEDACPATVVEVTLRGIYRGERIDPQIVWIPIVVTPRPIVTVRWDRSANPVGRDGEIAVRAMVGSSAPTVTTLRFTLDGLPGGPLEIGRASVDPHEAAKYISLKKHAGPRAPGDYSLAMRVVASNAAVDAEPYALHLHVPSRWERTRGWALPLIALASALLALLAARLALLIVRAMLGRRERLLQHIDRAEIEVPGWGCAFRPDPAPDRCDFTAGGKPGESDLFIPDPYQPSEPLFPEPFMKVSVAPPPWWRPWARPSLAVTPMSNSYRLMRAGGDNEEYPDGKTLRGAYNVLDVAWTVDGVQRRTTIGICLGNKPEEIAPKEAPDKPPESA